MLKNILKLKGAQQLSKIEQKNVLGRKFLAPEENECICNTVKWGQSPSGFRIPVGITVIVPPPPCCVG